MKHEIIYTKDYALIVSDEEMNENEYYLYKIDKWYINNDHYLFPAEAKKIIAHRPLTNAPILKGVPLLPKFIQEDDAENAVMEFKELYGSLGATDYELSAFSKGYNKAKETYKYTEEDLIKAFKAGHSGAFVKEHIVPHYDEYIQSLQQPKRPTHFIAKIQALDENGREIDNAILDGDRTVLKSTTDQSGRKCLIGNYI